MERKPKVATAATQQEQAGAPADGQEARQPMAEPEGGWPADEFTGKPGSYVRDPYTGVRSKLEE